MCAIFPRYSRHPQVNSGGRVTIQVPEQIPHGNNELPFEVLRGIGQQQPQLLPSKEEGRGLHPSGAAAAPSFMLVHARCNKRCTASAFSLGSASRHTSMNATGRRPMATSSGFLRRPRWAVFTIWGCGTWRQQRGCGCMRSGHWLPRRRPGSHIG